MNLLHTKPQFFSNCCFSLGLRVSKDVHGLSRRGVIVSYSTLGPPDISPVGFTNQPFWVLSSWFIFQGLQSPLWSTNPWHLQKSAYLVRSLSLMCHHTKGGFFCETVSLPLLPILMWSSFPLLWRVLHLVFRSLSERNDPYVALDVMFLWEEVSLGSSYAAILDDPPPPSQRVFFY